MSNLIQLRKRASYSYCAHSWRQQTNPLRKKFPLGWKCYKTIGSYVSCAFVDIWSTWEVWRARKMRKSCSRPRAILASWPIVNLIEKDINYSAWNMWTSKKSWQAHFVLIVQFLHNTSSIIVQLDLQVNQSCCTAFF